MTAVATERPAAAATDLGPTKVQLDPNPLHLLGQATAVLQAAVDQNLAAPALHALKNLSELCEDRAASAHENAAWIRLGEASATISSILELMNVLSAEQNGGPLFYAAQSLLVLAKDELDEQQGAVSRAEMESIAEADEVRPEAGRSPSAEPVAAVVDERQDEAETFFSYGIDSIQAMVDAGCEDAVHGILTVAKNTGTAMAAALQTREYVDLAEADSLLSSLIDLCSILVEHKDDGSWDVLGAAQCAFERSQKCFDELFRASHAQA